MRRKEKEKTAAEEEFEDLVRIAVNLFNVPAAAITFIDANRQWMKASHPVLGMPGPNDLPVFDLMDS